MANIKVARPNLLKTSKAGNKYVKVSVDGKIERVVVDDSIIDDWNNILEMEFGFEHYDASMQAGDEPGAPTGPAFDRLEVVDYTTTNREIALKSHEVAMKSLLSGGKVVVKDPESILV